MIIWLNGGFGARKTTLAEQLHRKLHDAIVYDPEDVGLMLWKWMAPVRCRFPFVATEGKRCVRGLEARLADWQSSNVNDRCESGVLAQGREVLIIAGKFGV